jgi:hypothetical protein
MKRIILNLYLLLVSNVNEGKNVFTPVLIC